MCCGSGSSSVDYMLPNYPVVRCVDCNWIFTIGALPRFCPHCDGKDFVTKMNGQRVEMNEG